MSRPFLSSTNLPGHPLSWSSAWLRVFFLHEHLLGARRRRQGLEPRCAASLDAAEDDNRMPGEKKTRSQALVVFAAEASAEAEVDRGTSFYPHSRGSRLGTGAC